MKKAIVGEVVHHVGHRGTCHAAVVTGVWAKGETHMRIFSDCNWKKTTTAYKTDVSYSKKPLHRTWHRLEECKPKEKK